MKQHTTNEVVMIRPKAFFANPETAADNVYQQSSDESIESIQTKAIKEFDNLVDLLKAVEVEVHVLEDVEQPSTPDSIFPNNWFSTHEDGTMVIYPMFPKMRRLESTKFKEKIEDISEQQESKQRLFKVIDYSYATRVEKYLEGTGAMVIDRKNMVAYCCLSQRANKELFEKFCLDTNHKPVSFSAQQDGMAVYHTNVIMSVGQKNAIICLDAIVDENERKMVKSQLENDGNNVIDISLEQVKHFLGNNLELKGKKDINILAMSDEAYSCLTDIQIKQIEENCKILHAPISTIEYYGGGSVRCMIAEIF